MDLYPAIDLRGGRVVRLRQGDYARERVYGEDPVAQGRAFAAGGVRWLHVVDLDGARSGVPTHHETIGRIAAETGLWVQAGGGVRSAEAAEDLLAAGATRVVLGTAALRDWAWFERVAARPSLQGGLALGLDARSGQLAVAGWREQTALEAVTVAEWTVGMGLEALIYTDISADGTLGGPDLETTRAVAEAADTVVLASGGIAGPEDLRALRQLPLSGVILGRALYDGALDVRTALGLLAA